ncbi:unnamed protein product [Eruca vesicaria subsp. sativa]|uniref:Uncharacterized protein n=1 Tax=Eruca vesicaria subsp. sativa TaxID=29727 RepID=A0ABC8M221_ERUVS|nr:unnamed protein product [Eruca vesicaria subsp. sativa]
MIRVQNFAIRFVKPSRHSRNCGTKRDQKVSEEHGNIDPETSILTTGESNSPKFEGGVPVPEKRC